MKTWFSSFLVSPVALSVVALAVVTLPVLADDLVDVELGSGGLFLTSSVDTAGWVLTVSTPDGEVRRTTFGAGDAPSYRMAPEMVDGTYTWEVTPIAAPRDRADGGDTLHRESRAQSGTFRVLGGAIVTGGSEESAPETRALTETSGATAGGFQTKDQQILDDLIVAGSACVGLDCVNGESFGFDTIRLKENNLRIKAQDTSNSASFPSRDWQLTFNETDNGGANKFSVDDIDGGRTPFTLEADAPSNSLYVDDGGRVGLGTATPVVEVHVVNGDTPTLRLEQNGSSGFTAQTFDVAANEASFFVRDVTHGSKLPFRIRTDAPESSLDIAGDGNIGMGTASPDASLHVRRSNGTAQLHVEEASADVGNRTLLNLENSGTTRLALTDKRSGGTTWFNSVNTGSYTISQSGTGDSEFELTDATAGNTAKAIFRVGNTNIAVLQADGDLNLLGVTGSLSDRNAKTDIAPIDASDVLARVVDLPIATWRYKHSQDATHMGPMAQDFYAAFGLHDSDKHIATGDLSGVALAAIQGLDAKVTDKDNEIAQLKESNSVLEAQNADLATRLAALEAAVAAIADAQN